MSEKDFCKELIGMSLRQCFEACEERGVSVTHERKGAGRSGHPDDLEVIGAKMKGDRVFVEVA